MKIHFKIITLALFITSTFPITPLIISLSLSPSLSMATDRESNTSASKVLSTVIDGHLNNAANQVQINQLDDASKQLMADYKSLIRQKRSLDTYNEQLDRLILSQEEELSSIEQQMKQIDLTQREITPLMISMLDTLEQFIQLDVPFLPNERTKRVRDLRALIDRADISVSEKFRKVIEAYQIENDYGRTIEAYRAPLGLVEGDGKDNTTGERKKTVDYLRVGRVAFFYQTIDGAERAFWNVSEKRWEPLGNAYRRHLNQGLRMARKQSAPDLLVLPVSSPSEAKINHHERPLVTNGEKE